MKKYVKAGKGTIDTFLSEVEDRIYQLEDNGIEMSTDIYSDDYYDEDDYDDYDECYSCERY